LQIQNNTDSVLTLVVDLASFTTQAGVSNKLVTGETRVIDSNKPQPVITIPPKSNFNKDFYLVGSHNWVPNNFTGASFVFGYRINNNERFIIVSGNKIESQMVAKEQVLGTVTVKEQFWNFLFLNSVEGRRKTLYEKALVEAVQKYGQSVTLKNVIYEGSWNGLSLLFYFSMLGFVEDASITASVVQK
jgi:hypothetical protein